MDIIDRRPNPHGKNLENRQRVLNKARDAVQRAARDAVASGKLREVAHGSAISIPSDALHEPSFQRVFTGGARDLVLSGNKVFSRGDRIQRPPSGKGGGGGGAGEAGESGGGEDSFRFVLTRDEFLDLFFDDLELPDLVKREIATTETMASSRAGLASEGSPSQLDLGRTMRYSMARRIGLRRPKTETVRDLEARIAHLEAAHLEARGLDGEHEAAGEELAGLKADLALALRRLNRIPWVDPVDLRYRRFTQTPKPSTRAVMFCLMDVSGSMTERMKDLAKQFFLLLHVFLERRHKQVDVVFIRHAEAAEEVDEEKFFTDPRTGGTIVSSALHEMIKIQKLRYPVSAWNIYVAQASDGDNSASDTPKSCLLLQETILPAVQYYAYIEIVGSGAIIRGETDLWRGYKRVAETMDQLVMRQVAEKRDIFPVFRDLFARRAEATP
nr:YeaH/YhbH family protein [uncultured Lichenicoccus sp.]